MTYRVGNHQPQNVYRDDAYIGVMFTAEDATLVVEALNAMESRPSLELSARELTPEEMAQFVRGYMALTPAADSCICTIVAPDPACIVHEGRRARGPKPPPLGEGCICDGSGRTCPRHGAVI